ncbi:MAG: hypothetical protein ACLFQB_08375 [Chitinispirillaceae bacterium]
MKNKSSSFLWIFLFCISGFAADTTNTIHRDIFNFGHQLGYIYSRMDDAFFDEPGSWSFETGFLGYYTPHMPMVRNDKWKERLMLIVPLAFTYYPTDFVMLRFEVTDLFVEFPYEDLDNMGGKSPRFETKLRLLKESRFLPAIAFTTGVKFSSAKPYTIWDKDHNYDESNGLAGAGTGVADYYLIFSFSKNIDETSSLSARIGLAPLGSPVEYVRGSAQADEIPYGLSYKKEWGGWSGCAQISGMYNGLSATELAHYSVMRAQIGRKWKTGSLILNVEHGLTRESDEWVLGIYKKFNFRAHESN